MTLEDLRPQLRSILRDKDLQAFFTETLAGHLDAVSGAREVRAVYNVLDLYSALEERRLRYLDKVRARLQAMAADVPRGVGRDYNQLGHMVPAFLRHIGKIREKAAELLRSALKPNEDNMDLVAFYEPGGLPKLDALASNLSLPSPFLSLDDRRYHLRPADQPTYLLGVEPVNQLWRLVLTNNTSPFTLFSFKPIPARFGAVRYVLTCDALPETQHLGIPKGTTDFLYFGSVERGGGGGGSLAVVTLGGEARVLVHRTRHHAAFLTWTPQDHQVTLTSPYPGPPAHWLLSHAQ
nr:uncharacterized protein LOC123748648 [Procambarus clarkii]